MPTACHVLMPIFHSQAYPLHQAKLPVVSGLVIKAAHRLRWPRAEAPMSGGFITVILVLDW